MRIDLCSLFVTYGKLAYLCCKRVRFSSNEVKRHDTGLDAATFKQAQLDFRQIEIEETVRVLRHINEGRGDQIFAGNPRREGRDLRHWRGRLAINNATIGGHSFGATLAVSLGLIPF